MDFWREAGMAVVFYQDIRSSGPEQTAASECQGDRMLKISPERWGLSCHFLPFVPECA
jgi:hypothetical protein